MRISIEDDKKIAIFYIEKNMISEDVDELEEKINSIRESNISSLIFDFSNVEYMCSSALGLIASTLRFASENNGSIHFSSLSKQLESLFESIKFLSIVNVTKTSQEALNIIRG